MSIRERLGSWIAGKRAVSEPFVMHPSAYSYFGPGIANQPDHETLLRENRGVSDMATRAIANRIGSLKPLVKVTRTVERGTTVDEILDDHPLTLVLQRPHPNLSWFQLARLTAQYIVTVGEGYWLKVSNGFGLTEEIHPIPAHRIFPHLERNVISGYRITDADGRNHDVDATDIVRFFFPDPENLWGSEGYLGPNAVTTDALRFSGEHLRKHYERDASPKSVLEVAHPDIAVKFDEAQADRFNALWRQRYHGRLGTEVGGPGMLPFGWKLVQMAMQTGADLQPLLEYWSDEQLMNFGTPKSILGKVVSGDRSSAETNQYVFDRYTIQPIAMLMAEGMTYQLAHDFDLAIFVEFEEFVSADKDFVLRQEESDLTTKVRSINQVREDRGLDPVPWGEEPVGQIGQMPYDPDMAYEIGQDKPDAFGESEEEEPEGGEPEEEEERARGNGGTRPDPSAFDSKEEFMAVCVPQVMKEGKTQEQAAGQCNGMWGNRARSYFAPEAEWQRQLAREKKYVPGFEREMKAVFGIQERKVLKRLKKLTPRARVSAPELFAPDEWRGLFERRIEPIRVKAFEAILGETLGGFGIDEFTFTDEMRFLLKQQGALLVKHANRTTQGLIARQLEQAAAEGEGVDQIAARIRGVFRTRRHHARTIARTEVLKATQEAQVAGFEASGVVEKKQWNTSMDAAVRDSHIYAEGQVRNLREPFDLQGEPADAPGVGAMHGQLSPGNSINCRCFVTPVLEA